MPRRSSAGGATKPERNVWNWKRRRQGGKFNPRVMPAADGLAEGRDGAKALGQLAGDGRRFDLAAIRLIGPSRIAPRLHVQPLTKRVHSGSRLTLDTLRSAAGGAATDPFAIGRADREHPFRRIALLRFASLRSVMLGSNLGARRGRTSCRP